MIFISAPYTGTAEQIDRRMLVVATYFAHLTAHGKHACSPLLAHFMMKDVLITTSHDFWLPYSEDLLKRCDEIHVLTLPGYTTAEGVVFELDRANWYGKTVQYVDDQTFDVVPVNRRFA